LKKIILAVFTIVILFGFGNIVFPNLMREIIARPQLSEFESEARAWKLPAGLEKIDTQSGIGYSTKRHLHNWDVPDGFWRLYSLILVRDHREGEALWDFQHVTTPAPPIATIPVGGWNVNPNEKARLNSSDTYRFFIGDVGHFVDFNISKVEDVSYCYVMIFWRDLLETSKMRSWFIVFLGTGGITVLRYIKKKENTM
jgi:hypothetical protein